MAASATRAHPSLARFDSGEPHVFIKPTKKIHNHDDIETFLSSLAYRDIIAFLLQLNRSMFPSKLSDTESKPEAETQTSGSSVQAWPLGSDAVEFSEAVRRLQLLLSKLDSMVDEVPPDTGPRRFGNISFRKWCEEMELRAAAMMDECLPAEILQQGVNDSEDTCTAKEELMAYLKGSFGSSERLDYGTGHELSFLAFLASLWKLNAFAENEPGIEERGIVLGVIEPYFKLVRRLISTYTLEPAGSHGVWGLDDHSFIPYILGSAQLSPAVSRTDPTPVEGSLPDVPAPNDVTRATAVARERETNMYFSAIGFIHDVKRGPFWEHSPMLYDISGIQDGWAKINKGMIKMYNAEVLSKFPVVQHFPFGSLFRWQRDPDAAPPPSSTHMASGPQQMAPPSSSATYPVADSGTRAPWASQSGIAAQGLPQQNRNPLGATAAPWGRPGSQRQGAPTDLPRTTAPWTNKKPGS